MDDEKIRSLTTTSLWFFDLLTRVGIDLAEVKQLIPEIYQYILENGTDELSEIVLRTILNTLEKLTNDEHIGLLLAQNTTLEDVGLYGFLLKNSKTIEDFLLTAVKYYPILYRAGNLELVADC